MVSHIVLFALVAVGQLFASFISALIAYGLRRSGAGFSQIVGLCVLLVSSFFAFNLTLYGPHISVLAMGYASVFWVPVLMLIWIPYLLFFPVIDSFVSSRPRRANVDADTSGKTERGG